MSSIEDRKLFLLVLNVKKTKDSCGKILNTYYHLFSLRYVLFISIKLEIILLRETINQLFFDCLQFEVLLFYCRLPFNKNTNLPLLNLIRKFFKNLQMAH